MTEVKTQLDAETGEERRWEEERVEVVIDLTGEHEDEAFALSFSDLNVLLTELERQTASVAQSQ